MKIKKQNSVTLDYDIIIFSINKKQCLQSFGFFYIKPLKIYTIQIEIIQCILKYITIETKLIQYTHLIKQYRWNFYNANKNYTKQMKRYRKQRDIIELILNYIK